VEAATDYADGALQNSTRKNHAREHMRAPVLFRIEGNADHGLLDERGPMIEVAQEHRKAE
jgi:hypothetical protein